MTLNLILILSWLFFNCGLCMGRMEHSYEYILSCLNIGCSFYPTCSYCLVYPLVSENNMVTKLWWWVSQKILFTIKHYVFPKRFSLKITFYNVYLSANILFFTFYEQQLLILGEIVSHLGAIVANLEVVWQFFILIPLYIYAISKLFRVLFRKS